MKRVRKSKNYLTRKFSVLELINILVMVFLLLPIAIIIIFSFNPTSATVFPMSGFTTKWYKEAITNEMIISSLLNSIYVGLIVALISVCIGVITSFALTRYHFKFKEIMLYVALIPISFPAVIMGIALLSFFVSILDISTSLLTVTLSHVVFCAPFVILVMNSRLSEFDISIEEAAKDLGANTLQTFRYVTFPLIRPSLIGSMMLAFAVSFDEFPVTFFVVGRKNTLPIVIWGMLRRGISPSINAIATIVLVVSVTLIIVANRFLKLRALYRY